MLKKLWKNNIFWEVVAYITLACLIVGQVTVGYWYLFAQSLYLFSNVANSIRDIALKLPKANLVRDLAFTAITIGLIIIKVV